MLGRTFFCGLLLFFAGSLRAQDVEAGHSLGKVSTDGDLIVVELDDGALGATNLFNLTGRTLRFVPRGSMYGVQSGLLRWDSNYGAELAGGEVELRKFAFPFSGEMRRSFIVGSTGSIRFGVPSRNIGLDPYGHPDGGVVLDRFDQLSDVVSKLLENAPAICVFLKPRLSGHRYVKELSDRVVITWDLTEPFGGLLDFSWFRTTNLIQAVIHRDGTIEMSYKEMSAKDAIVGIFPILPTSSKPVAVHLSSLLPKQGPFASVYESFHYLAVPRSQDLPCTVLTALGDRFDFLAYYSDFRIDSQEASPPSDGPVGGKVSGIGQTLHDQSPAVLASRCTRGRFQLGYLAPVYVGANEAQENPPAGAPVGNSHDITFYQRQLAEASPDRKPLTYSYAIGHLGHEVGHRWGAYVAAKIASDSISLGTWPHWAPGLQTRVAFPYSLPIEASTLGGGAWQDNLDGTFTQLRDGFFVPASGYSPLDLYLMGLISAGEVPDFFILRNLVKVGTDKDGHQIFRAYRTKLTIQDVIAAAGPRLPDVHHSQREFNTGIVLFVEHGKKPSPELVERANGIRRQWIRYWDTVTGHRATMTVDPNGSLTN
ncbi:MAG TPA: hypothetical protein VD758_09570 [Gemmatimonadaceae bacterium]|nr:hypothetical protein [Gemmatimonadaceae bacterium]